jgi:hypothetical protein
MINHAIALKELDRKDDMESVLTSMDWSACALQFEVALAALRDDNERLQKLLPRLMASGDVLRSDLEEWPLFAHQRGTAWFAQLLSEHFPQTTSDDAEDGGDGDQVRDS